MRSPSPRVNEAAALEALARLKVLDSEPEAEFDALVHAASVVCGTPISLISLIDSERQWFKANVGLGDATETPRDVSFCGHAVLGEQVFEIPDATSDVRFHDNPLVTGSPNVRFYAGAPIQLHQGEIVGTLCVVDHVPRSLDDSQRAVLAALATAVAKALEGRRATREISAAFEEVIDSRRQLVELNQSLERRIEERTFELRESVKSADVANRAKSDFLSNMSHEIRTPMNGVIGLAHVALLSCTDAKQRDYLRKIEGSGQHLLGIINSVLSFSKVEAGAVAIDEVSFDLSKTFDALDEQMAPTALAKGLTLMFQIDEDLIGTWRADELKISQILRNYIDNAIRFTASGTIRVHASRGLDANQLRVAVQDSGIGLSAEQAAALFQPFKQADSSTTRLYGGTGLGLAICKRLAALMSGEVGVDSEPGVGSTFWFTASIKPMSSGELRELPARSVSTNRLDGVRVLVVEDNPVNREVAMALLEMAGASVDTAEDGSQALRQLGCQRYDCILMDLQMPILDGFGATSALRAGGQHASTPVIALTANAAEADQQKCLEAGMNDFIPKPLDPDRLIASVYKWSRPIALSHA